MNKLFPDDVVIAILHGVHSYRRRFTTDREQLHSAFYELKQNMPELLGAFRFRNKGLFPESDTLDQALSNLESSGLLHRHNDTPRFYFIQSNLDDSFSKFVKPRLTAEGVDEDKLNLAAAKFSEIAANEKSV